MKFEKPPASLVTLFDDLLKRVGGDRRQMFGSPAAFGNGHMFAGLFGQQFFVRLGEADRQQLLNQPGARVFDPMGGRPMKEYVVLPTELLADRQRTGHWIQKALAYVQSLPPKAQAKPGSSKRPRARSSGKRRKGSR